MLTSKYQHTVNKTVVIQGVGVHSGEKAIIKITPAAEKSGIVFLRTDVTDVDNIIKARWDNVVDTRLCTAIANKAGVRVSTVEHLMSAFATLGVDNAIIEIDGPEIPIMDGSAKEFIRAIKKVGLKKQNLHRKAIKIKKAICATDNGIEACLSPADDQKFSFEIEFPSKAIGIQEHSYSLSESSYDREIAPARTFGMLKEVEYLRSIGLARGGSLENAIVVDDDTILNPEGLRFGNEFVRHKILDAIGDLYMAGMPVIGHYHGYKSSHAMNNKLLHELFANPESFEIIDYSPCGRADSNDRESAREYVEIIAA